MLPKTNNPAVRADNAGASAQINRRLLRHCSLGLAILSICLGSSVAAKDQMAQPTLRGPIQERPAVKLTRADVVATLDALDYALSTVKDGGTYVWHRAHGRLTGFVTLKNTFRHRSGKLCRRLRVELMSGSFSKTTTGTACQLQDGSWRLGT
ncbi:MAG: hypothetical protein AAF732_04960 [Pseudomonadota bacterium]